MRRIVSSKHIENVSDLTLAAPIRQGFVDATDNITYESRLRLVMEAMFKVRSTAREYARVKPFVESAERIQALLDFRLAILDGYPKKLLLSVAFDRPFEPYMRLVWDPLGPLLDLFFCNCEDYVVAAENSFPDYMKWVRSVQIDSSFFYAASNRTIVDGEYLARIERLHRDGTSPDRDIAAASEFVPSPMATAADVQKGVPKAVVDDLGIQAVVAIARLFDYYPPDNPAEFKFLNRAAYQLLRDWKWRDLHPAVRARLAEPLRVLDDYEAYKPSPDSRTFDPAIVQGGILRSYDPPGPAKLTHACLLLMRVRHQAAARAFLHGISTRIGTDGEADPRGDGVNLNIAFTHCGLKRIGVPDGEIAQLPQDFLEGMEARAGLLGDIGESHPRRWTLPPRCRAGEAGEAAVLASGGPPVQLSEVDVVLKLRIKDPYPGHELIGDDSHPLAAYVRALVAEAAPGLELLAAETMRNATPKADGTDHFRFKDGISQPIVHPGGQGLPRDRSAIGEVLIGFPNDRKDPAPPANSWWDHGTFLVVRKLRQDVDGFKQFLDDAVAQIPGRCPALRHLAARDLREEVRSKLMGRHSDGRSLIKGAGPSHNNFDYESDMRGQKVPFQSHVRRTNPRAAEHGHALPRIMRRGLSYGPPRGEGEGERGVMFMAYNASIAEQFEIIQGWVNGGNSTRVASCQSDPLMGQARSGDDRTFLFRIQGEPVRLTMPKPFVSLQWGAYLFVPSLTFFERLAEAVPGAARDEEAMEGAAFIARVQSLPKYAQAAAWKTCFEDVVARDPDLGAVAPAVWAAIRARGGAMRVPYGDPPIDESGRIREAVLVASNDLVNAVLKDDKTFSVRGYCPRMEKSIGMIYLGRDDGEAYRAESVVPNAAVGAVTEEQAFASARAIGAGYLSRFRAGYAQMFGGAEGAVKLDLANDYVPGVLGEICARYFGFPDDSGGGAADIERGTWRWTPHAERKPVCPGDFLAPSSYIFYIDPVKGIERRGPADGEALRAAAKAHFQRRLEADPQQAPQAPIPKAIFDAFKDAPDAADMIARTVIGVMMGFLPPADGNLRGALYDWIKSRDLWRIQHDLLASTDRSDAAMSVILRPHLIKAMQKRPAPDGLWRTATRAARLGPVDVCPGDKINLGIVSATAELAQAGSSDVSPIFGGDRSKPGHPTHACPAYKFAIGAMLGTLCALLEVGRIEEMPAPLIVTVPRP